MEENKDKTILEITHLTKNFSGTKALDDVSFTVYPGEIHALLGENGAGKSTLIKILDGLYSYDAGDFRYHGKAYSLKEERLPVSVIHQDLGLIDDLSVMENIAVVAGYAKSKGIISWKETRKTAGRLLERMGCDIDLDRMVGELPSAERSMVAISRALAVRTDILILDEPTATLPQTDVEKLFSILRTLKSQGMGIIYVSHRLDEVFQIADRVTVLRNGRNISTKLVKEVTGEQLVYDIVGKKAADVYVTADAAGNEVKMLEAENLCCDFVRNVSFTLHQGEILTLFGLRGAGHHEVGRLLYGVLRPDGGELYLEGKKVTVRSPDSAIRKGIGFLSSKRLEESMAPLFTVRENIYMNPVAGGARLLSILDQKKERERARSAVERFQVKPRRTEDLIGTLSGGNQQKVVLSRLFEADSRILVLEEPTIGVDIGAKADIYRMMKEAVADGKAIILISSDFEEVSRISHRVLVFGRGRVRKELKKEEITAEKLTLYASS